MARTSAKAAAAPVEPEVADRDYAEEFAAKQEVGVGPGGWTRTQEHFGAWVTDATGVEFKTAKERDAFELGARSGLWLRMAHQASEENKQLKEELAKAKAEGDAGRETARTEKAEARKAAAAEKAAAPAPARRTRASAKPAEEAAPAPTARRGGRRRASAAAEETTTTAAAPATGPKPKATTRPAASGRPGRAARRGGRAATAEAEF